LPDGTFSKLKYKFGYILEVLAIEDVDIFYAHLVHFHVTWYIFPFWYVVAKKIWQP
jgi:hypothetical protein